MKLPVAGGSRVNECKGKLSYFVNRKNAVTISRLYIKRNVTVPR